MAQIYKALLLAAAMIGIGLLAIYGIVPASVAQWAPLALIAMFPSVWMGSNVCRSRKCGAAQ